MSEAPRGEALIIPEQPTESDRVTATLYRTVYRLERDRELDSGMMHRPQPADLLRAFDDLFAFEGAGDVFNEGEVNGMRDQVQGIFAEMSDFKKDKLRAAHETSYPQTPIKGMASHEVSRCRPPHRLSGAPDAVFYLSGGGTLVCRHSDKPEGKKGFIV